MKPCTSICGLNWCGYNVGSATLSDTVFVIKDGYHNLLGGVLDITWVPIHRRLLVACAYRYYNLRLMSCN